uniref:Uncharacterized protein n=1 Tax=Glossina pallidipes TaxID=7398 RepID=A0A1B0AGH3_GLOPL
MEEGDYWENFEISKNESDNGMVKPNILEQCLNKLANMNSTIEGINLDLSSLGDVIDISRISFPFSNDALPLSSVELNAPTAASISLPDVEEFTIHFSSSLISSSSRTRRNSLLHPLTLHQFEYKSICWCKDTFCAL